MTDTVKPRKKMFDHFQPENMVAREIMERFTREELENMILYEVDREKKTATITMNRAEKSNAMPIAAFPVIRERVRAAELDEDVRCIILKGNGEHFGAGGDATELALYLGYGDGTSKEQRKRPTQMERIWADRELQHWESCFTRCTKVIISQVQGYCYGQHLHWACESDIVIAAENSLFTHPAWRYIGPVFNITLLIELCGLRKAQDIMCTARPMTAKEAEQCGLITKMVPLEQLEQEVAEYAKAVVCRPMDGLATGKALIEWAMISRGLPTGEAIMRFGHPWKTNLSYVEGDWNFVKRRRDLGATAAFEEVDLRVAPRFRQSMERRKLP